MKPLFLLLFSVLSLFLVIPNQSEGRDEAEAKSEPSSVADGGPVLMSVFNATVNPGTTSQLKHAILEAERREAEVLLFKMSTPGGLLSATRAIVNVISEAKVPVVTYVAPEGASATSAGAFILLSSHFAVMNKGTNVGASSPVSGDGKEIQGTMAKKVMNDTTAFMRSIAESRGRNIEEAEKFVTEATSWTAEEALEKKLIDFVVTGPDELLSKLHGKKVVVGGLSKTLRTKGKSIELLEPGLMDRILVQIAHPQIALMLLSLGSAGIFIEVLKPGLIFPGVFGAISLIISFVSLQVLPVEMGFLALLIFGIILMIAEVFVSGFGILGIGGAIAFILGSINLFNEPFDFEYQSTVISISIGVGLFMLLLSLAFGAGLLSGFGASLIVGEHGKVQEDFEKEGFVLIGLERWRAISDEPLKKNDKIKVVEKLDNNTLKVTAA